MCVYVFFFLFQAEDGIRDLVRSRGLGDVYKRQLLVFVPFSLFYLRERLTLDYLWAGLCILGAVFFLSLIHI